MNIRSALFKPVAKSAPRVRSFTKHCYFGHPILDAWFAWFPLNQIEYGGAAIGEIYNAASRIDDLKNPNRKNKSSSKKRPEKR